MPPMRTASRLSMPLGERMARASETSCCRYFLYSSADASVTIIKQTIAIPPYLRVFLIMFSSAMQSSSHDTRRPARSEEHTSELQSLTNLVCRLLLEKKKEHKQKATTIRVMQG